MPEVIDKKTHAQRRRAERYEEIKAKIKAAQLLHDIEVDLKRDIATDEIQQVRLKMDARFKLLNKVIPDVRSVEHSGEVTQTHYVAEIPRAADTVEEWTRLNGSLSGDPSPALKTH